MGASIWPCNSLNMLDEITPFSYPSRVRRLRSKNDHGYGCFQWISQSAIIPLPIAVGGTAQRSEGALRVANITLIGVRGGYRDAYH